MLLGKSRSFITWFWSCWNLKNAILNYSRS
jgi:hypothetical protein